MAGLTPKTPKVGGASVPKGRAVAGVEGPKFQKTVRAPNQFPHLKVSRRDYSKPEVGAEQPLGFAEGQKSGFSDTGLTGET